MSESAAISPNFSFLCQTYKLVLWNVNNIEASFNTFKSVMLSVLISGMLSDNGELTVREIPYSFCTLFNCLLADIVLLFSGWWDC